MGGPFVCLDQMPPVQERPAACQGFPWRAFFLTLPFPADVKSLSACARLQLALAMAIERQGFLETATSALARSIDVCF